jgi:hypothetical protein
MTNVVLTEHRHFQGWDSYIRRVGALGPKRLAIYLASLVQASLRSSNGVFVGDGTFNFTSHTLLVRVAVRLWIDDTQNEDALPLTPFSAEEKSAIRDLLREANSAAYGSVRRNPGRQAKPGTTHLTRDICQKQWAISLQHKGRNASSKHEIARTWLYLRTYWPAVQERIRREQKERTIISDPLVSAFDSLEYIFLFSLILEQRGPLLARPLETLQGTELESCASHVVDSYAVRAVDAIGSWVAIKESVVDGNRSPFVASPILLMPNGSLFTPDPSVLFNSFEERLLNRMLGNYEADGSSQLEKAHTILGYVFEEHMRALLHHMATRNCRYRPEFKLSDQTDSADAFLLFDIPHIFEAKATPFPVPYERHWKLEEYFRWLNKLAGERSTTKRRPFDQAERFLRKWEKGDAIADAQLGPYPGVERIRYLIVTPETLPITTHWRPFRGLWSRELRLSGCPLNLCLNSVFLSIHDLEVAAAVVTQEADAISGKALIAQWSSEWERGESLLLSGDDTALKPALKDYLVDRYASAAKGSLVPFMNAAFVEAFESAGNLAMGSEFNLTPTNE